MSNSTALLYDLLEVIHAQQEVIEKQNDIIASVTNENLEKENMINVLMDEFVE